MQKHLGFHQRPGEVFTYHKVFTCCFTSWHYVVWALPSCAGTYSGSYWHHIEQYRSISQNDFYTNPCFCQRHFCLCSLFAHTWTPNASSSIHARVQQDAGIWIWQQTEANVFGNFVAWRWWSLFWSILNQLGRNLEPTCANLAPSWGQLAPTWHQNVAKIGFQRCFPAIRRCSTLYRFLDPCWIDFW